MHTIQSIIEDTTEELYAHIAEWDKANSEIIKYELKQKEMALLIVEKSEVIRELKNKLKELGG